MGGGTNTPHGGLEHMVDGWMGGWVHGCMGGPSSMLYEALVRDTDHAATKSMGRAQIIFGSEKT